MLDIKVKRKRESSQFLYALLVSSAFITPAKGMIKDEVGLFDPKNKYDALRSKILIRLDDRDLKRAKQVSKNWKMLSHQIQAQKYPLQNMLLAPLRDLESTFAEKKRLFSLILDLTDAEPNEVQRARDSINLFLTLPVGKHEENDVHRELYLLLDDLEQPEDFIDLTQHHALIACSEFTGDHPGLGRLRSVLENLERLNQSIPTLSPIFYPLILFYQRYMERLFLTDGEGVRRLHLTPKVIMSGEGLVNIVDGLIEEDFRAWRRDCYHISQPGISSYRISQQKARALFSINEKGELDKPNPDGTHCVTLWKNLQGGVVCKSLLGASNGLSVGMESTMYWLAQSLFGRGMAASSLLTFKGLKIDSPLYDDSNQHAIQVADKIEGMSLEKFILQCRKDPKNYSYDQLDLVSFGEQIILSLLTNPTDGKPDNFFVTRDKSNPHKWHIVGIDNDMALGPSIDNKPQARSGEAHIKVCNILYFLPLMEKDIPTPLQEKILNLNIDATILKWLGLLRHQENEYNTLQKNQYISPQMKRELGLPVKLPENTLQSFKEILENIKGAIRGSSGHLTYQQLFHAIEPLAEKFYENIFSITHELEKLKGQTPSKGKSKLIQKMYQESIKANAPFNCSDVTTFNPILSAYYHVHQNNRQDLRLETVLEANLRRPVRMGELMCEAVDSIAPHTAPETKRISLLCEEFLSQIDLTQQQKTPFIHLGLSYFKDFLQTSMDKTQESPIRSPALSLHPSWKDPLLLLALLKEGAPEAMIDCLLEWGWDPGVCDPEKNSNVFHYGTIHPYSHKILKKMLEGASITSRDFIHTHKAIQLLNTKDRQGKTPLDWMMDKNKKNVNGFIDLIHLGAQTCDIECTFQFYCDTVLQAPGESPFQKAFIQLIESNAELKWRICWHHMESSSPEAGACKIQTRSFGDVFLHPWVKNQVIDRGNPNSGNSDSNNSFIPYPPEPDKRLGNHLVSRAVLLSGKEVGSPLSTAIPVDPHMQTPPFPLITHHIFFKPYPELPGLEEAVGRLTRLILGFGAPYTELVNLNGDPVMVSQGIQGKNLLDVVKNEPELLSHLDLDSVSGLILLAMLINPEDGKPDNYILEPHPTKPGKYRLICVDNDHAFVPAVAREVPEDNQSQQKKLIVQVKSILYCLEQMKEKVPTGIQNLFRNINPYTLLKDWLTPLQSLQDDYINKLFKNKTNKGFFKKDDNCYLNISFPNTAIKDIFQKFLYMRDIFSVSDCQITHIELLKKLESFLAKRYAPVLNENISVYERFKKTDGKFYLTAANGSFRTQTRSHHLLESQYIQDEQTLWNWIRGHDCHNPIKALAALEEIREKKEAEALSSFFKRIFGEQKVPDSELKRQEMFSNIDFSKYTIPISEQQALLNDLSKYKLLNKLAFQNCSFLNDEAMLKLTLDRLRKLDLRGCQQITNTTVAFLAEKAKNLQTLNLSGIKNLDNIGQTNIFGILTGEFLEFSSHLQNLSFAGCTNLTRIYIKAPNLHYLSVENCLSLTDQMLDGVVEGSATLQKLVVEGCPLIGEKELRKLGPPYRSSYWRNFKGKEALLKILASKGAGLEIKDVNISPQGLMAFERAFNLSKLTSLDLNDNYIGADGAKALSQGNLSSLTSLNLMLNNIGIDGAKALSQGNLSSLTSLNLSSNNIGADGAKALSQGNLSRLIELDLWYNNIGADGTKALSRGNLISLTSLNLGYNKIEDDGTKALSRGNLISLTSLSLGYNKIGDDGAKALSGGNLLKLTSLNLNRNNIGADGTKALSGGNLSNLISLDLWSNNIGDDGARALSQGNLSNLTELSLSFNGIENDGARALSGSNLISLTSLSLGNNNIGAEGAKALSRGNLSNLTSLSLGNNKIGTEGAKALSQGNLFCLTALNLSSSSIGNDGTRALSIGNLFNLKELNLGWNKIGADGAKALSGGNLSNLTSLSLGYNHIGDDGAKALSRGNLSSLTSLDLYDNYIWDDGAKALSGGNLLNLTSLNLENNKIGYEGQQVLVKGNFSPGIRMKLGPVYSLPSTVSQAPSTGTNSGWDGYTGGGG